MKSGFGVSFFLAAAVVASLLVTPQAVLADTKVRVYVAVPPPNPRAEVIGVAPSSRHGWVNGYHRWDGKANVYVWVPGHWQVKPKSRVKWSAGHWERDNRGWYWIEGAWR